MADRWMLHARPVSFRPYSTLAVPMREVFRVGHTPRAFGAQFLANWSLVFRSFTALRLVYYN